ncbi:hypothetical protein ASD64_05495 [Mesorhizobium sp. Root157]|uniref:hypothetical protein n=1 Tax=Mesorhizobium sp. Root157 TaxID=1736477 RepID=UPI0006F9BD56|nr:hypothetical protein [Mesorhizobium sp. Root157]KQZ94310.1 hypothetical protein ASD64_05495 [Mesorhizobium sp. Root157]
MNSKSTKEKRRRIPGFTLKELEESGKIPPYTHLMDSFDHYLAGEERKAKERAANLLPAVDNNNEQSTD